MERLQILNHSNDGFHIASEDLKLRGPGDIFGIRQSGEFSFVLGDIYTDASLLKEASEAVDTLLCSSEDTLPLRQYFENIARQIWLTFGPSDSKITFRFKVSNCESGNFCKIMQREGLDTKWQK